MRKQNRPNHTARKQMPNLTVQLFAKGKNPHRQLLDESFLNSPPTASEPAPPTTSSEQRLKGKEEDVELCGTDKIDRMMIDVLTKAWSKEKKQYSFYMLMKDAGQSDENLIRGSVQRYAGEIVIGCDGTIEEWNGVRYAGEMVIGCDGTIEEWNGVRYNQNLHRGRPRNNPIPSSVSVDIPVSVDIINEKDCLKGKEEEVEPAEKEVASPITESPILESASSVVEPTTVLTLPVENPVPYVTPPPLQRVPYDAPPKQLTIVHKANQALMNDIEEEPVDMHSKHIAFPLQHAIATISKKKLVEEILGRVEPSIACHQGVKVGLYSDSCNEKTRIELNIKNNFKDPGMICDKNDRRFVLVLQSELDLMVESMKHLAKTVGFHYDGFPVHHNNFVIVEAFVEAISDIMNEKVDMETMRWFSLLGQKIDAEDSVSPWETGTDFHCSRHSEPKSNFCAAVTVGRTCCIIYHVLGGFFRRYHLKKIPTAHHIPSTSTSIQ
ncbi:hypothetical protein CAEBREN_14319 [Caenorhabditis brenneri]|uniref:Maelstrom domain-containing protein n=1 Tax=Caenorhabditis brenneri TaxID=135651 RepID=G0MEQ2_CAEBE|nr:hypothetical protein CAEBREN_14319 [Caenorhabditis brenneri]